MSCEKQTPTYAISLQATQSKARRGQRQPRLQKCCQLSASHMVRSVVRWHSCVLLRARGRSRCCGRHSHVSPHSRRIRCGCRSHCAHRSHHRSHRHSRGHGNSHCKTHGVGMGQDIRQHGTGHTSDSLEKNEGPNYCQDLVGTGTLMQVCWSRDVRHLTGHRAAANAFLPNGSWCHDQCFAICMAQQPTIAAAHLGRSFAAVAEQKS